MRYAHYLLTCVLLCGCSKAKDAPPPSFAVTTTPIEVCDVPIYLEYIGHIEAFSTVNVYSQVEGIITGNYFIEGQEVKQGDLLFTIDSRPYVAALHSAEAALLESQANLKISQDYVRRYAKLVQDEYVAQLDFDQYSTNVTVNEAAVLQNEANLETAKINLDYCSIRSPIDGITGEMLIKVGNLVPNGTSNPLLVVNQIKPIFANFTVPERDLPFIRQKAAEGQLETRVYLTESLGKYWVGDLNLINNQVNMNTGSIMMRAIFKNEDLALWPGQFAIVKLIVGSEKNGLLIPLEAIMVGQKGNFVFVVKEDLTVEQRTIIKGQVYQGKSLVIHGLSPTDVIVLEGQVNLYNGAHVTVKDKV